MYLLRGCFSKNLYRVVHISNTGYEEQLPPGESLFPKKEEKQATRV